jgi:hypothetical protein
MKVSSPRIMAYPGPPRRAAGLARYLLLAVIIVSFLFYFRNAAQAAALKAQYLDPYFPTPSTTPSADAQRLQIPVDNGPKDPSAGKGPTDPPEPEKPAEKPVEKPAEQPVARPEEKPAERPITKPAETHPIDTLIQGAENTFDELLKKESHDLKSAAAEYRRKRGRHPPPGFDKWFEFAQQNKAVMVEDFFDQIYHDLNPFWGLPASTIRKESWDYDMTINVRKGQASAGSNWFWTQIWLNMTQTIQHLLPDMDIPLNAMDEPRILVPWEEINGYMEKEQQSRVMPPANEVVSDWQTLDLPGLGEKDKDVKTRDKAWEEVCKSRRNLLVGSANRRSSVLENRDSWL